MSYRRMTTSINIRFKPNPVLKLLPLDQSGDRRTRTVRAIYAKLDPLCLPNGRVLAISKPALEMMSDLSGDVNEEDPVVMELGRGIFSGCVLPSGAEPAAHCYAGHQFGNFAGQLGDGAAICIGRVEGREAKARFDLDNGLFSSSRSSLSRANPKPVADYELGLKGSGLTPFSRFADGRKVLRSSIREFLASEAMHALGIPTTRSASIVASESAKVSRDVNYSGRQIEETCAVITRISKSFFRFGSFEIAKRLDLSTGRSGPVSDYPQIVVDLIQYCVKEGLVEPGNQDREGFVDKPEQEDQKPFNKKLNALSLITNVSKRTGHLVALWQCFGFTHGVLNTDNMSILGETIDYGPFGFVEYFDSFYTPNTSDPTGRYSFRQQPEVCRWNCEKLAEAVGDILLRTGEFNNEEEARELIKVAAEAFDRQFQTTFLTMMRAKLAIRDDLEDSDTLNFVTRLLELMEVSSVDFTRTFRELQSADKSDCTDRILKWRPPSGDSVVARIPVDAPTLAQLEAADPAMLPRLGVTKRNLEIWRDQIEVADTRLSLTLDDLRDRWEGMMVEYREIRDTHKVPQMNQFNPNFVLRNYLIQRTIVSAEQGDFQPLRKLLAVALNPYAEDIPLDFLLPQPEHEKCNTLSCSS